MESVIPLTCKIRPISGAEHSRKCPSISPIFGNTRTTTRVTQAEMKLDVFGIGVNVAGISSLRRQWITIERSSRKYLTGYDPMLSSVMTTIDRPKAVRMMRDGSEDAIL